MRAAVHVGQLLQPVPGGIGRYVRQLVASLPAAGVEVTTFATGTPVEPLDGRHVDLGWPRGAARYELWHRLRWPAVRAAGDVVHATSLAVPPPGGRPLVVTVHDLVFLRHPEHLTARGVAFHRRGLELTRRHAAAIVVPTAFGRDDLVQEGFEPARIHVAHHGVELGPVADATEVLATLGIREPFLLFVSTLEPRKGIADVLAAHARLRARHPALGLVLAGPAGWGAVPVPSDAGIHRLGAVSDRTLDALYRSAVALAHPARYEGFGMTPLEAMARGCPVVVSDAACLPEVVGDGGVIVPTGDVDALTEALGALVGGAGREALVAAGPRRAASFTWAASAAAHARAYAAATAGSA